MMSGQRATRCPSWQRVRCIVIAMVALVFPPLINAQDFSLPEIGDYTQQYVTETEERQIGKEVLRGIARRGALLDDVQLTEYLASVGQRLAVYAPPPASPYTFFWVDNPRINAFAAPGAYIGVHTGLLLASGREDELAGVLAHEIAHVSQRHIARAIADARQMTLPTTAALIASMVLAATVDGDLGQAAIAGTLAAGAQRRINFTRTNEQEADRVGTRILQKAGFDASGLIDLFARLQRQYGRAAVEEYLTTHPLPTSRIADLGNRLADQPYRGGDTGQQIDYQLAKARARVLTASAGQALIDEFETRLNSGDYASELAERYGYALALRRAGRVQAASEQVAILRRRDPDRLAFRLEEAELALVTGNARRAWQLFESARQLYGNDFSLAIHYARALVNHGQGGRALDLLRPLTRRRADSAELLTLYAQAAQEAGDRVEAHSALADYHRLNGELEQAIEQLEVGLRQPRLTPFQEEQLRAKLRRFEEEAKIAERSRF